MKKFILSFIIFFTSSVYATDLLVVDINPGQYAWTSNAFIVVKEGLFTQKILDGHTLYAGNEHCLVVSYYKNKTNTKMNAGNYYIQRVRTNFETNEKDKWIIISFAVTNVFRDNNNNVIRALRCKVADPNRVKVSEINKLLYNIPLKIVIR